MFLMSFEHGCHPIFPFTAEEKQKIRQELGLKESAIEEDIDMILEWFVKQPHLVSAGIPERGFIERMLIQAKGSREKTKRRLDNFYRSRSLAPELIQNRAEYLDSTKDLWSFYKQIIVPKLFDLKRLSFLKFTDPDPNNFDNFIVIMNSIMLGDIRIKYDYMLSDIWVFDLTHTSIRHLLRVNPLLITKGSRMFLDGFGIRVHAVHIVGAPSYAAQFHQFFSKFVNPKLMERLILHESADDLHKHFPKEFLPKDYGGDLPSFSTFKEKLMAILKSEENKQFWEESSKMISDETKRPGGFICDDYLPGSFKKLDLD